MITTAALLLIVWRPPLRAFRSAGLAILACGLAVAVARAALDGSRSLHYTQQQLTVYVMYVALAALVLAARWTRRRMQILGLCFVVGVAAANLLYMAVLARHGLNGRGLLTPRPFSDLALVALAWGLAWRHRHPAAAWLLIGLQYVLITASMSRLSWGISTILIASALIIDQRTWRGRSLIASLLAGVAVVYGSIILYIPYVHDRFFYESPTPSAGLPNIDGAVSNLNTMGRLEAWKATWHFFLENPIIGHGAGSASRLVDTLPGYKNPLHHPHQDYLRVLADFGVLGFCLFIMAIVLLWLMLYRGHRELKATGDSLSVAWIGGALWLFPAVGLTMMADNILVYATSMGPATVLVALGLNRATHRNVSEVPRDGDPLAGEPRPTDLPRPKAHVAANERA